MAQILTIDVLHRFHNNAPTSMAPLYTWKPRADHITLTNQARDFIIESRAVLELIANKQMGFGVDRLRRISQSSKIWMSLGAFTATSRFLKTYVHR